MNNPIATIDILGDKPSDIIITGSSAFKKQAFEDLQKLSSIQLTMLPDGKVIRTTDVIETRLNLHFGLELTNGTVETKNLVSLKPKPKPTGTALVLELIDSKHTVAIAQSTGNGTTSPKSPNNSNGIGDNSNVGYNPTKTGANIVNVDNTMGRPPYIGLAHELAHAEHHVKGTYDGTIEKNLTDPENPKVKGLLTKDEVNVRKTDSKIRKEQGVVERKQPY